MRFSFERLTKRTMCDYISVIIDCEIGEKRTLVSNRARARFSKVDFECINGKIKNLEVYGLKNER